jgi:hypothetical protein
MEKEQKDSDVMTLEIFARALHSMDNMPLQVEPYESVWHMTQEEYEFFFGKETENGETRTTNSSEQEE